MKLDKTSRVKGRLELSNSKLNTILEITNAINENSSKHKLFSILKKVLVEDLNIGSFTLFTFNEKWRVSLNEKVESTILDKIDIQKVEKSFKEIEILNSTTISGLECFDIVIPVYHNENPLAYLLLADLEDEKIEISPIIRHLKFIQSLANIIVVALENKRLTKEYIKQIAVKKELELAQNMQSLLFPRKLPNSKNLEVNAYYEPHSEVGGDYYDLVELNDHKTAITIADVSGKGMPAALLMANFQANLRALLNITSDLKELVKLCNNKVIESANYEKFITLFICIFDSKARTLEYLNAGHQPGILKVNNQFRLLNQGCTVLGMFDELPKITSEVIKLEPYSTVLCFTDGLSELEDANNIQLEVEGLKKIMDKSNNLAELKDSLEDKIEELKEGSDLEDDITFLLAEFLR